MSTSILSVISLIIFTATAGVANANPPTKFDNATINVFNFGTDDTIVINVSLFESSGTTFVSLLVLDCTPDPGSCVTTSAWEGDLQGDVIQTNGNGRTASAVFDTTTLVGEGIGGNVVVDCVASNGRTKVVTNGNAPGNSFHLNTSLVESTCQVHLFGAAPLTAEGIVLVNRGSEKISP